jgi:uncharacterized membrane protein
MGVKEALAVLWVAAMPVMELRAAIPLAFSLGFRPVEAYLLGVLGSLLPVPVLLLLLRPALAYLKTKSRFSWFEGYIYGRAKGLRGLLDRYGLVGLVIFVAVPLPSTGAWTGALAASLLGMRLGSSMLAIAAGTAIAGAIVTLLSWHAFAVP